MNDIFFLVVSFSIQIVILNQCDRIEVFAYREGGLNNLKRSIQVYFYFLCLLLIVNIGFFTNFIIDLLKGTNFTILSSVSGLFTLAFAAFTYLYYNQIREISKNSIDIDN